MGTDARQRGAWIGTATATLLLAGASSALVIEGTWEGDVLHGTSSYDTIRGKEGNDFIKGLGGSDSLFGDGGDDDFVWDDGDGSDFIEGGADGDELQLNLDPAAGDELTVAPNGSRFYARRTNLMTFTLDVGTVEILEVRGHGGDDRLGGQPGLAGLVSLELHGGADNDVLLGGDGSDVLRGDSGDDTLRGNLGGDLVRGGYGNDLIIWHRGDGSDVVYGDEDQDILQIHGSPAEDEDFDLDPSWGGVMMQHSSGEYLQVYSTERIEIHGDAGNDRFYGATGLAALTTLEIDGGPGEDHLSGGDGDDTLRGGDDDDMLWGHAGDDVLIGGPGDDWFIWLESDGFDGSDTIEGDDGADFAQVSLHNGGADAVSIFALGDRVRIQRNNLTPFTLDVGSVEEFDVNGNQGDDTISASSGLGNVSLDMDGGDGNDFLVGGDGPDALWGGDGDDTLLGGDGDDTFLPGSGNNVLQGGLGDDYYHLGRDANDAITDYESGERIHVRSAFDTSAPNLSPGDDIFELGYFQQWTTGDGDTRLGFSSMEGQKEVVRIYDVIGTFRSDPTEPFIVYLPEPGTGARIAAGLATLLLLGRTRASRSSIVSSSSAADQARSGGRPRPMRSTKFAA